MNKKKIIRTRKPNFQVVFSESPIRDDPKDTLRPDYALDNVPMRSNRFAGRVKYQHGGARKNAGRKRSLEPLVAKRVYLYARQIKKLQKVDKNLSAAIRKLADAQ